MASAVASPLSTHYKNGATTAAADRALWWWIVADPQNQWWWMQIGVPRIICKYLLLLPNTTMFSAAMPLLNRAPMSWAASMTGCNKVWGATVNVLRGLLEGNLTRVEGAFAIAWSAVTVATDASSDGLQLDGSFHQHGPQLYSGWGYGAIFTTNVLVLERYAADTEQLQMPDDKWAIFARLVLDGQQPASRGPNFDFLACGRLFTYFVRRDAYGVDDGHYHYFAAFSPFSLAFPSFAAPFTTPIGVIFAPLLNVSAQRARAAEFQAFQARLLGPAPANGAPPPPVPVPLRMHAHYHDSDYAVHQRAAFAVMVRMQSNRTKGAECVNEENKRGITLADGATTVYADGTEYAGVFPVLNWTTIAGTTELQTDRFAPRGADLCDIINHDILQLPERSGWVGGVSDGEYGLAGQVYSRDLRGNSHLVHGASIGAGGAEQPPTLCNNASSPASNYHCNIAESKAVGAFTTPSVDACAQRCCSNAQCSCWTWAPHEPLNSTGPPTCFLKRSHTPLEPRTGTWGGTVHRAPPPPPPSPTTACLRVAKSWFFLDEAVIALGAGLRRSAECAAIPVTTALQQSNLVGDVFLGVGGSPCQAVPNNTKATVPLGATVAYAWHNGIAYASLPTVAAGGVGPAALAVSTSAQYGSEFAITQGDNATISLPVFSAVLEHPPTQPGTTSSGQYAYAIVPAASAAAAAAVVAGVAQSIAVVANTELLQAVCRGAASTGSAMLQANIYPGGGAAMVPAGGAGCWDIEVQNALRECRGWNCSGAFLQIRKDATQDGQVNRTNVTVSVAVPTRTPAQQPTVTLTIFGVRLRGESCTIVNGSATMVRVAMVQLNGGTSRTSCELDEIE